MIYWIQTFSGKRFDLENPRPADVDITDIIQALSNICRFNGHCRQRYTVLEHWFARRKSCRRNSGSPPCCTTLGKRTTATSPWPLKMVLHELTKYETRCGTRCDQAVSMVPRQDRRRDSISLWNHLPAAGVCQARG